jgi:hypothetical protein
MRTRIMVNAVLIPTTNTSLAKRCFETFSHSLHCIHSNAIIVYNGPDENVVSDYSLKNAIFIGYSDAKKLVNIFADNANVAPKLLFGETQFNRSYGGASNLLFAIAYFLGAECCAKIDDDCINLDNQDSGNRLLNAFKSCLPHKVFFGKYTGTPTNALLKLDEKVRTDLCGQLYPQHESDERLGKKVTENRVIKNGNLFFMKNAMQAACYPVLYEPNVNIHGRGEVYYWYADLKQNPTIFEFVSKENILLKHSPQKDLSIQEWLCSIALCHDLHGIYWKGKTVTHNIRLERINQLKNWLLAQEWPHEVNIDIIVEILDHISIPFTDRIIGERNQRKIAWEKLLGTNLLKNVQKIVPRTLLATKGI